MNLFDMDYQFYLRSDLWFAKRAETIRRAGYRCEQCKSMVRLEVHHLNYQRLGNERKQDLVLLFEKCHDMIHGKGRRNE